MSRYVIAIFCALLPTALGCKGGGGAQASRRPPAASDKALPDSASGLASASDCDAVGGKIAGTTEAAISEALPSEKATVWIARIAETLAISCKQDKWPNSVVSCILASKDDPAAMEGCTEGHGEIEEKAEKRMQLLADEMMKDLEVHSSSGGATKDGAAADKSADDKK